MGTQPSDVLPAAPSGAPTAFEALYAREYQAMVRLAHLLMGSRPRAEDLVHDAFVRVIAQIDKLERPGAYLRTAVVNACRSAHRRDRSARRAPGTPQQGECAELPGELVEFFDALQRLPHRQRSAVVLRYYLDLPDDEIAQYLGCKRATVRVLIHRGLARLREVIEP